MKISGFSYVRNGFKYGCPFVESIKSILPICDEFVIAVGDSDDGTRDSIIKLNSPKIKIIDTKWDLSLRKGGEIFSQQANIALDNTSGNWLFHLQADEVIHENDLQKILNAIKENETNTKVDGFILPFLHFWGDYNHIRNTRRVHKKEIRLFRSNINAFSFNDSQGFRKYTNKESYLSGVDKGKKLNVKLIKANVFHYNRINEQELSAEKTKTFSFFWGNNSSNFNFEQVDRVEIFEGAHPNVMKTRIESLKYKFKYDKSKAQWVKIDKLIQPLEDLLGFKFGEYKNYKLIK